MKNRSDWSGADWIVRYICLAASLVSSAYAIYLFAHERYAAVPLLFGVAMVVNALSWVPDLLSNPRPPRAAAFLEPIQIPRIASLLLVHGTYWLISGLAVMCFLGLS